MMRKAVFLLLIVVFPASGAIAGPEDIHSPDDAIRAMIEAHGSLKKWRAAPAVSFTDLLLTTGSSEGAPMAITVEQTSRRAYIDVVGAETSIAWDGERAWGVNWNFPMPPRFLALLNYYFLNLPWLVRDPGVVLSDLGKAKLWDDPTEFITVRVTYEAGVGDTPEDYYVLYIHPETHRLSACEYVVTYAGLLPPGVKHTPPHILVYEEFETVDDLLVPTRYTIYETDHKPYATCEITDWSFSKPFDESRMEMPENAVLDTSNPTPSEN